MYNILTTNLLQKSIQFFELNFQRFNLPYGRTFFRFIIEETLV